MLESRFIRKLPRPRRGRARRSLVRLADAQHQLRQICSSTVVYVSLLRKPTTPGSGIPIHPAETAHRIHGHVIQQVQPTNIDSLRRHRNVVVLHVLEERRSRRQVPHFIAWVVPLIEQTCVHGGSRSVGVA